MILVSEIVQHLKAVYDSHNDGEGPPGYPNDPERWKCQCGYCSQYVRGFGDLQMQLNLHKVDPRVPDPRPAPMERFWRWIGA